MRKIISILLVLMLSLSLFGCSAKKMISSDIYSMSTVITLSLPENTENSGDVISQAKELIYSIENAESVNIKGSDIAEFNESENGIENVGADTQSIITTALDVANITDGAFNPCMGTLTSLWDITGENPKVPSESDIKEALSHTDYSAVLLSGNILLKSDTQLKIDTGGITKGYALQKTVELLSQKAEYGTVSFGGNVGVFGKKPDGTPWKVGIKSPYDNSKEIGYIQIDDGYVAVSGDYERYFTEDGVRYHHIINPETGYPTDNGVHSVAVYCRDAALGDALSTALFVMGKDKGTELYRTGVYDFEALFITDDGVFTTDNLDYHGETN